MMDYGENSPKRLSIKDKLHPNGHIIGGTHDRGMELRDRLARAGMDYFKVQVGVKNILFKTKTNGSISYEIIKEPQIAEMCIDELGFLRAQSFIRDNENKWINKYRFWYEFREIYANLVDKYKN